MQCRALTYDAMMCLRHSISGFNRSHPIFSRLIMKRTYASGAAKRKKAKFADQNVSSTCQNITTFFVKPAGNKPSSPPPTPSSYAGICDPDNDALTVTSDNDALTVTSDSDVLTGTENSTKAPETFTKHSLFLSDDPSQWPSSLTESQKTDIVRRGPTTNLEDFDFPRNSSGRRFSTSYYFRVMENGEKVRRTWLVYSTSNDCIYCFCCKVFGSADVPLRHGTNTWEGLGKKLKDHERGRAHLENIEKWIALRGALKHKNTIDHHALELQLKEANFWKEVMKRLIDVIIFLSEKNLAFRGTDEHFGSQSNGNFLGIIELISKYDDVLKKLVEKVSRKKVSQAHYLSPSSQNEIINAISNKIVQKNMSCLRDARYYSLVLDCTPDVSHKEQMSLILRYVECIEGEGLKIEESFFGFINVDDTTGKGLMEAFLSRAEELGLDIGNMRGQAYDNGANMKGCNKGVQARILDLNKRALFFPCAAHSLNLVANDTAKSSSYALSFFGTINRVYVLFSSSPARWSVVQKHLTISVKLLSETRWESRTSAIKPFRYQLDKLVDALEELCQHAREKGDSMTFSEANSIISIIMSWRFVLSVIVWYEILTQVNKTSKLIQSVSCTATVLVKEFQNTLDFLKNFRDNGLQEAKVQASNLAATLNVEPTFPENRPRFKSRMFDYENVDEPCQSAEDQFRINYFLVLVDTAISSTENRFKDLSRWLSIFGFIHERNQLLESARDQTELQRHCSHYSSVMGDIDEKDLAKEIERFKHVLLRDETIKTAYEFLEYILKNEVREIYPNLSIALRVLLTTPVSVASAERSFSRLKLIKNFLRSTMSNERLSALATISIEREAARSLNVEEVITDLSTCKTRNKIF